MLEAQYTVVDTARSHNLMHNQFRGEAVNGQEGCVVVVVSEEYQKGIGEYPLVDNDNLEKEREYHLHKHDLHEAKIGRAQSCQNSLYVRDNSPDAAQEGEKGVSCVTHFPSIHALECALMLLPEGYHRGQQAVAVRVMFAQNAKDVEHLLIPGLVVLDEKQYVIL